MSDQTKQLHLELLIGLRQHLDDAERLRRLLEQLLALAEPRRPRFQRARPAPSEGLRRD
jgi:hypothetical protein